MRRVPAKLGGEVCDLVFCGTRDDVARRALKHRDVRRAFGHRGHECDSRRSAADYHDALACVVEILGPLLRMHNRPAKSFDTWPLRSVTALVVVVTSAEIEKVAGELDQRFVGPVSASTVHRALSDDHDARRTRWL